MDGAGESNGEKCGTNVTEQQQKYMIELERQAIAQDNMLMTQS